jgi:hypothetical protein
VLTGESVRFSLEGGRLGQTDPAVEVLTRKEGLEAFGRLGRRDLLSLDKARQTGEEEERSRGHG